MRFPCYMSDRHSAVKKKNNKLTKIEFLQLCALEFAFKNYEGDTAGVKH